MNYSESLNYSLTPDNKSAKKYNFLSKDDPKFYSHLYKTKMVNIFIKK